MFKLMSRVNADQDQIDPSVPPSERGKGENMTLDGRLPSSAFGIVGLTYPVTLFCVAIAFLVWTYYW